jgi:hypothetical protein
MDTNDEKKLGDSQASAEDVAALERPARGLEAEAGVAPKAVTPESNEPSGGH